MNPTEERRQEPGQIFDLREADAQYRPFPSFEEWAAESAVNSPRWERYAERIRELKSASPDLIPRALEAVKRAAAWDTGAIEGLYETNYGFTLTVAMEVAALETLVAQKGEEAARLFESQLKAYDYVLDFATQRIPIAEAWIRELHKVVCESQETYEVQTPVGTQRHSLPKGEYKRNPNHVLQRDGSIHSWAPVDSTPQETHRLCEELRSDDFNAAHPVMQAAYAHYAFVSIHPFADGNGRVARALASVFTYRTESIPLLILRENTSYLPALEGADHGNYQQFVDFILEAGLDAIKIAEESFRTAIGPSKQSALADLKSRYLTRGGYTHEEVDSAGYRLIEIFQREINRQMEDAKQAVTNKSGQSLLQYDAPVKGEKHKITSADFRSPVSGGPRMLHLTITSASPANARVKRTFGLEVPKDCGREDDLAIRDIQTNEVLAARVTELLPVATVALQMRVSMAVERMIGAALAQMNSQAAQTLRGRGY